MVKANLVDCVLLPVLDVDVADTTHQQLQLALVEDLDEVPRNDFAETFEESVHLLRNPRHESPTDDKTDQRNRI